MEQSAAGNSGIAPQEPIAGSTSTASASPPRTVPGLAGNDSTGSTLVLPSLTTPSGGGAIKGMNEAFNVNLVSGTASLTIPLPVTKIPRWGTPNLSLSYDSGGGNGIFGLGWTLSGIDSISRKTNNALPEYLDDQDVFTFGGEDLVPLFKKSKTGDFVKSTDGTFLLDHIEYNGFTIQRYQPRIDHSFSRIERWTSLADLNDVHWRVISTQSETRIFGRTRESQVSFGERIFSWQLCEAYDRFGNAQIFEWKAEDSANVATGSAHEQHRSDQTRGANKHLKRIKYGNQKPNRDLGNWSTILPSEQLSWLFEVVFDYGEHDAADPKPEATGQTAWPVRQDPFSTFLPGFDVRTYRLCRRVLMFHHFEELGSDPYLTSALELVYNESPSISFLLSARQVGFSRAADGSQITKRLPPIELQYTEPPTLEQMRMTSLQSFTPGSIDDLPSTASGALQWAKLQGDSTAGLVSTDGGAWYYKRNLSKAMPSLQKAMTAIEATPAPKLIAKLGASQGLPVAPNLEGAASLTDIDNDGLNDLLVTGPAVNGYYKSALDDNANFIWQPFQPFASWPTIDLKDPNLRMLDLTGDGCADILITRDDELVWYTSGGVQGFGAAHRVASALDEEYGPRVLFSDPQQSIYLADISGDGSVDIVRIRSAEICYWPNLGFGRFGSKITMDNSPAFASYDDFDQHRIVLCDFDGSGTTDVAYFGTAGAHLYLNQAGNSWSDKLELGPVIPDFDSSASISAVDLFGTGTACFVFQPNAASIDQSSPRSLMFIDFMNGVKPHLLRQWKDNRGSETVIGYVSSTNYFLQDEEEGTPWATRLPFPVQCVDRVVQFDRINRCTLTRKYRYHHGYYDGIEREFRGFGMVEECDTESFDFYDNLDSTSTSHEKASYVAPVHTKSWFHLGALDDAPMMRTVYAKEFHPDSSTPPKTMILNDYTGIACSELELREASRALKGSILHTESFDESKKLESVSPFAVTDAGFTIRMLQPQGQNLHAVYQTFGNEQRTVEYNDDLSDSMIKQTLTLKVDDFGNVLKSASIAYGRSTAIKEDIHGQQQMTWITFNEHVYTNAIGAESSKYHTSAIGTGDSEYDPSYCSPQSATEITYEISNVPPASGKLYSYADFAGVGDFAPVQTLATVNYYDTPTMPAKRVISSVRSLYRSDDLASPLSLGVLESLAIPAQGHQLVVTSTMLPKYEANGVSLLPTAADTFKSAGYLDVDQDGSWWTPSPTVHFAPASQDELAVARQSFFRPKRSVDAFNNETDVVYDQYSLLLTSVVDALGNQKSVDNDYAILQPQSLTDENGNVTLFTFDALGRVAAMAQTGKGGADMDSLAGVDPDPTPQEIVAFLADPVKQGPGLLASATIRFVYDDEAYLRSGQPLSASSIHAINHGGQAPNRPAQIQIMYQDATGHPVQHKTSSTDDQWLTSGWTVYNNKGLAVQQFEPFFDTSPAYAAEARAGYSSLMFYDSRERQIAVLYPDTTWTKTVYDNWSITAYDQNDTVELDPSADREIGNAVMLLPKDVYSPSWYMTKKGGGLQDQLAAKKSSDLKDTPEVTQVDALGRACIYIRNTGSQMLVEQRLSDIQGRQYLQVDGLQRIAERVWFDMLGRQVQLESMDRASQWSLHDINGSIMYQWRDATTRERTTFDALRRPLAIYVKVGNIAEVCWQRTTYGESASVSDNSAGNLRGKVYKEFDQSGTRMYSYDFKGNTARTAHQLAQSYNTTLDWSGQVPLETTIYSSAQTFDAFNRVLAKTSVDGSETEQTYNENGLLNSVRAKSPDGDWTSLVSAITYDAHLREIKKVQSQNKVVTTFMYDPISQRLAQKTVKQDSATIQDLRFTYDAAGHLVVRDDNATQAIFFRNSKVDAHAEYTYDGAHRLIEAKGREHLGQTKGAPSGPALPSGQVGGGDVLAPGDGAAVARYTETYSYDLAGNVVKLQHSIDDAQMPGWTRLFDYQLPSYIQPSAFGNRVFSTAVGQVMQNYSYDDYGNTLSMPSVGQAVWDARNQLRSITQQAVNDGKPEAVWYVYDSSGARVRKVSERHSSDDSGSKAQDTIIIEETELYNKYNGSGQVVLTCHTLHVYDDRRRIAMLERWSGSERAHKKLPQQLIRFQYSVHNGSVAIELDENGQLLSYEEYTPYGGTTYQSALKKAPKRYRFAGKERDRESGLYYSLNRYYMPWLCRWLNTDPLGTIDGMNAFEYVSDNPIQYDDPSGTMKTEEERSSKTTAEPPVQRSTTQTQGPEQSSPQGLKRVLSNAKNQTQTAINNMTTAVSELVEDFHREGDAALGTIINRGHEVHPELGKQLEQVHGPTMNFMDRALAARNSTPGYILEVITIAAMAIAAARTGKVSVPAARVASVQDASAVVMNGYAYFRDRQSAPPGQQPNPLMYIAPVPRLWFSSSAALAGRAVLAGNAALARGVEIEKVSAMMLRGQYGLGQGLSAYHQLLVEKRANREKAKQNQKE